MSCSRESRNEVSSSECKIYRAGLGKYEKQKGHRWKAHAEFGEFFKETFVLCRKECFQGFARVCVCLLSVRAWQMQSRDMLAFYDAIRFLLFFEPCKLDVLRDRIKMKPGRCVM
jgi:hypothetical protein